MDFIAPYTAYIERELLKIDFPLQPAQLYDPIRYFIAIGGKRIRPVLTLLGIELFGKQKQQVIQVALAIELFHNFTLLHDDIMDEAPLRRKMPTVHKKWSVNTAILAGDVLLIKAYELLASQEGDTRRLLKLFNKTAVEVCQGQQMDLDFEQKKTITIDEYQEMIRLKTSVLLASALEMSALLAQADEKQREHVAQFGINIGLAFQVKDDILDLYADPKKFGKQIGGDILANKKTMLHLLAQQTASQQQLLDLEQLGKELDPRIKIAETKKIFDLLAVEQRANEKVNAFFEQAQHEINQLEIPNKNKQPLIQLSHMLLGREV